jgi:ATP-dependent RNA helicase MSS116
MAKDIGLLNNKLPTFLIATPGRLVDHLEKSKLRGRKFSDIMAETSILVLDEADRLMEGFPKEMKNILSYLPRTEKRQTLLFSATLPKKMMRALEEVLPDDYAVIDCVANETRNNGRAANEADNIPVRVQQSYIELDSMHTYVDALTAILSNVSEEEKESDDFSGHKIIVFFPTARIVKFFAELFREVIFRKQNIYQMHSRMSQNARNKISSSFREAKQGILLTTDVSARGKLLSEVLLLHYS